jgi:fibronectin type 3 domain-containing protein
MVNKRVIRLCMVLMGVLAIFAVLLVMPQAARAATATLKDAQQEDAYTDNGLAAGYAYPADETYRLNYTNNLCSGTIRVNYVGGNVANFGLLYQRAAVKFNLTGISGTITSATLKIHVVDAANTPLVNLISTTDNSWTQTNQAFPSYNAGDIINSYSNVAISANSDKTFDVKDYVQSRVDGGVSSVSFVLTGTEGGDRYFNFVSNLESTQTSLRPVLDITYTPVADSPLVTGTTPTNNTRPTWSWSPGGGGNGTYRYKLDNSDLSSGATTTTSTNYTPVSALSQGTHTLYVQESNGVSPVHWSESGSLIISVDTTPPNAPTVAGTTPTNDTTPTWNWTAGGGGNGTYRYKLDNSDLSTGATETATANYTPGAALGDGTHTLYVQERDTAGNWSMNGSFAIVVDITPPTAPTVAGTTPTNDTTPTWSWTPGGGGNGTYRYKLDNSDLSAGAMQTTTANYTPGTALGEGTHTLYVQERDAAGNWSASGSFAIVVDVTPPTAPTVTGTTPTNDTTPTWNWTPGGGGNGTYRYKLDNSDLSAGTTQTATANCTPGTTLSEGTHTLYVQERDAAGNWSANGSFAIVVDITPPTAPTVTGTTPTTDTTPTWSWTPGGGGNGTYRYKLDNSDLSTGAATTNITGYTSGSDLPNGSHTLYVQERDAAGNWSVSGSFAIAVNAPTVSVTGIAVTGAGGANSVSAGRTLQMAAAVSPSNATNKNVTWSIASGSGASIDPAGLLTASTAGTVKVRATAQDGSGIYGEAEIAITTPPPAVYTIAAAPNNPDYGTAEGAGSYTAGSTVTLRAVPAATYCFIRWLEGLNSVSTGSELQFTAAGSRTLTAEFMKIGTPLLTAAPTDHSSVTLAWTAVPGANEYEVYRADSASGTYSLVKTTSETGFGDTGLTANIAYYYKVRVKCTAGAAVTYGGDSEVQSAKPVVAAPAVNAKSISYTSIRLSWTAVPGASKYEVYRATSAGGSYSKVSETASQGYTDTKRTTGKTYYYKVRAYVLEAAKIYGNYSVPVSAKPVPSAPTNAKAAKASSKSIRLTWASVSGATKYEVYRAASTSGKYSKITATSSTRYTNTGLKSKKTYYYKIRAYRVVSGKKVYGPYSDVIYKKL